MVNRSLLVSLAVVLAAAPVVVPTAAGAQSPPRYRIASDTLHYSVSNPYRVYWVRGADTLGNRQHEVSIESHLWRGTATSPELVIQQLVLNVNRRTTTDTFSLSPDGRVKTINNQPPTAGKRVDLLLRLPLSSLTRGTRWSDSLRAVGKGAGGEQWYDVAREYRVVRLVDTLGMRGVADVSAQGTVRMRFGFWVDSAAGKAVWMDVTGPVTEHYLFATNQGRLLRRTWSMDLHGTGVGPEGTDTIPAGLLSKSVFEIGDSPRLDFLLAQLPGADTSVSVDTEDGGALLLHTVARAPERITSSLSRNDGMVGVATATFVDSSLAKYEATWADTSGTMQSRQISIRGDSLLLQRTGKRAAAFALPDSSWGIADYAMQESLAPVLLRIPRDGAPHPFAVFRPYAGHWDSGTAVAENRAGLVLVRLTLAEEDPPESLLFTPDGDYLFGENSGPDRARRVPINAARQQELQRALEKLRGS